MLATVTSLAENPTLKAALDTWQTEGRAGGASIGVAVATVQNEVRKIAASVGADVLAVVDAHGVVVASAGPKSGPFTPGTAMAAPGADGNALGETVVLMPGGAFRVLEVPLEVGEATIGSLELGTALDEAYARKMKELARADSAIVIDRQVWATTLPPRVAKELGRRGAMPDGTSEVVELGGESWLVRHINSVGPATFLAMASIDAAASAAMRDAYAGVAWIAVLSLPLAALGSFWLARTLTRPIDQLSAALSAMAATRRFNMPVPATGTSRELDALANTFNALIQSLAQAEAQTQAAYLGAIHALAAALDARDPYTAGHSERVSALSVEVGRALKLDDADLATLRLGALLHDIGKIGVPDEVLRKESALSADRVRVDSRPPDRWRPHLAIDPVSCAAPADCRTASRAARRTGVSLWPQRRCDSARCADRSRRRCVRCDDERTCVSTRAVAARSDCGTAALHRQRFRPGLGCRSRASRASIACRIGRVRPNGLSMGDRPCRSRVVIWRAGLTATFAVITAIPAGAQTARVAIETVAAVDTAVGSTVSRKPGIWLDIFAAVRIRDGLDLVARPVLFRNTFTGSRQSQLYQLGIRYERPLDQCTARSRRTRSPRRGRADAVAARIRHAREPARSQSGHLTTFRVLSGAAAQYRSGDPAHVPDCGDLPTRRAGYRRGACVGRARRTHRQLTRSRAWHAWQREAAADGELGRRVWSDAAPGRTARRRSGAWTLRQDVGTRRQTAGRPDGGDAASRGRVVVRLDAHCRRSGRRDHGNRSRHRRTNARLVARSDANAAPSRLRRRPRRRATRGVPRSSQALPRRRAINDTKRSPASASRPTSRCARAISRAKATSSSTGTTRCWPHSSGRKN